jgi:hypothetical protein
MRKYFSLVALLLLALLLAASACRKENARQCPAAKDLISAFSSPEGAEVQIYADGNAYINENGICRLIDQYFDPAFMDRYAITDSGVYIITEDGQLFPTDNDFIEDFESYTEITELFAQSIADTAKHWNAFTLQSPQAKTVQDYVALRQCILERTCTFRDNRFELTDDPLLPGNQTLKFTSVAPSPDMVTAKCSIESTTGFFRKGDDCWFEARYFIESGMPFTLVDFENGHFLQSPGPRVTIRNGSLGIENKFGTKLNYTPLNPPQVPLQTWFRVKVHFHYSEKEDGLIELWQDGQLLLSENGINLPTSNSVQDNLEIGISATSDGAVMYMDDVRISDHPF